MLIKEIKKKAFSLSCSSFSFNFPFIWSIFSYTPSIVLYSLTKLSAVFSPTPETPGILSDVSPANPLTSIKSLGFTPYSSFIFLTL